MRQRRTTMTSKWVKTVILMKSPEVAPLIPETSRMTAGHVERMLHRYGMVYVKPERGTYGNGVMRVEMERGPFGQGYKYQSGTRIYRFDRFDSLYRSLRQRAGKRSYLVQRGIPLLKHGGRRFDLRVMVQLSPKGRWETTGLIGRVAAKGKAVTNYHSGGKPTDIHTLLAPHMSEARERELVRELKRLGQRIGRFYGKHYPGFHQLGIDIGLDPALTPWIIEVNTNPDPYIFNQLHDKSMYRKVMAYRRFRLRNGH
ncbi:YheC/YheD family protein [Paenibacillus spiritus]|uniref:YheC/YheD family protein n=1 Tax=Paenibacillus spiritus TaxID=2496557 RepID=A0A5J5G294_9BACL|nr:MULTISPECIES: YheC/YheD family protein [Paenibacillus]KAA9000942.1 YheC/YheD family protein [Paenibacillus spiritus]